MQPAARLTAAIELLIDIEDKMAARGAPADALVSGYFRARRYAGSKDKRAISGYIYDILRARELYLWALKRVGAVPTARNLMILHLLRHDEDSLKLFGQDNPFAPTRILEDEEDQIRKLRQIKWEEAPVDKALNIPQWALSGFEDRFGKSLVAAATALNRNAPLDIRVNGLKNNGSNIKQVLNNESELFEKNKYSLHGYRANSSVNLGGMKAYKDGLIEVQDEAAQLAACLADARPGMQVVDLCAGAGGKSLAMAVAMQNSGQIHAFDISTKRLGSLKKRMQRAGARNIQVHRVEAEGAGREIAMRPFEGKTDRVIVDAPCSGTGTWRRSPDLRWRFEAQSLSEQTDLQLSLLKEGAALVKSRGWLVYMTCSLLPVENEDVVSRFLEDAGAGAWKAVDYREVWQSVLPSEAAVTLAKQPEFLQLAPHTHGTDGFFLAILERTD